MTSENSLDQPASLWNLIGTEPVDVDLVSTDQLLVRARSFPSGAVFANHFHTTCNEIFVGLMGNLTVGLSESDRREIAPSVTLTCGRRQHHYLVKESDQVATTAVIKSPNNPDDTTVVDWHPSKRNVSGHEA